MMMMMMMNYFCGMVDRRKAFSLISSRDHCQRSSPSRISDTPLAGFEPAQNLSSGFVEGSCAVVITTTPRRQISSRCVFQKLCHFRQFMMTSYFLVMTSVQAMRYTIQCPLSFDKNWVLVSWLSEDMVTMDQNFVWSHRKELGVHTGLHLFCENGSAL